MLSPASTTYEFNVLVITKFGSTIFRPTLSEIGLPGFSSQVKFTLLVLEGLSHEFTGSLSTVVLNFMVKLLLFGSGSSGTVVIPMKVMVMVLVPAS